MARKAHNLGNSICTYIYSTLKTFRSFSVLVLMAATGGS